ncbi:MAG: glycosyltransferase [Bacteroidales bacterium]|nr:glycosyltransferase [Bacteroidales bacterium]MBN2819214.1 glycosyltransferase [Bacteroidales bacterium]
MTLLVVFVVFFLIQLYYYLGIYLPLLFFKEDKSNLKQEPVSVIICARNEAQNLERNLRFVLEQNYPDFEVIVVDDCSTDNTDEVLGIYLTKYKNLKTTTIPLDRKFSHGKKLAVTVGIKSATNENLIFTDADCTPESENWLGTMQRHFLKKDIVLGYGGYEYSRGILNNYIRYDALTIAMQYLGFARAGIPYMGIGRNLGYKKSLFFQNKGFAKHYGVLSGDDDLFVNEVSNKKNTTITINPESFTRSVPKATWSEFFTQKVRHFTTSDKYKSFHIFLIGMESVSRAWFYTTLIILLTLTQYYKLAAIVACFRLLLQIIIYGIAGNRFKEKNIWLTCFIFDVISLFFNFVAYFSQAVRGKKNKWK